MRARVFMGWMLACLIAGPALGQVTDATQRDFHTRVTNVYNFSPHLVTPTQQKEKASEMDSFWKDVKADSLKWLWQRSDDAGATWKTQWEIDYTRTR